MKVCIKPECIRRYNLRVLLIPLLLLFTAMPAVGGADETPALIPITLGACLEAALNRNIEIVISGKNLDIQEKKINQSLGIYDPKLALSLTGNNEEKPAASLLEGAGILIQKQESVNLSMEKLMKFGTRLSLGHQYNLSENNSSYSLINPSHATYTYLSVTQPLLKGAGSRQYLSVKNALNSRDIFAYRNELDKMALAVKVEKLYWDYYLARESGKVKNNALQAAMKFLEENREKVRLGMLPPFEETQAEAGVIDSEQDLMVAENNLSNLHDALLKEMNLSDSDYMRNARFLLRDAPDTAAAGISEEEAFDRALAGSPAVLQKKKEIEGSDIQIKSRKNDKLPSLDLKASMGVNSQNGLLGESYRQIAGFDNKKWTVSLQFEYPLGNRSSYHLLRQAEEEKAISLLEMENLKKGLLNDIRNSIRNIRYSEKKISAAAKALELAGINYEAELQKYDLQKSTAYDVLNMRNRFFQAQTNDISARIDLMKAVIDYRYTIGTILKTR